MAKFVLIFHGGETPEEPSPEVMDRWMAWFGQLGAAVVDTGAPFGESADAGALTGCADDGLAEGIRIARVRGLLSWGWKIAR